MRRNPCSTTSRSFAFTIKLFNAPVAFAGSLPTCFFLCIVVMLCGFVLSLAVVRTFTGSLHSCFLCLVRINYFFALFCLGSGQAFPYSIHNICVIDTHTHVSLTHTHVSLTHTHTMFFVLIRYAHIISFFPRPPHAHEQRPPHTTNTLQTHTNIHVYTDRDTHTNTDTRHPDRKTDR